MFKARSQNPPPEYTFQTNWQQRISGGGVVWYHDFENDAEVDNFLNMAQNAPFNSFCTFGVHDRILHAHRTAGNAASLDRALAPTEVPIPFDQGLRGHGCLQLVSLGATLAADVTTDPAMSSQVVASGTFTLTDTSGPQYTFGTLVCPTLTAPFLIDSNTVNDKVLIRISGSGSWDRVFSVTSITTLGGGLSQYNITQGSGQPNFISGTATNFTVEGYHMGQDTCPTSDFVIDTLNAPYFPDPDNNPAKFYCLAIQTGEAVADSANGDVAPNTVWYPVYPGQVPGSKGIKEFVTVIKKTGNTLTVRRGGPFSETASFGNRGFPTKFLAGSPIGNDCDGGWSRWMSAVASPANGKPVGNDDPGNPKRPLPVVDVDKNQGYYGHSFYHTMYPTFDGHANPWDGDDIYLQFRFYLHPNRLDQAMPGGKLWFLDSMNGLTAHQCIGDGVNTFDGKAYIGTFGNKGSEQYTDPQGDGPSLGPFLQPDEDNVAGSEKPLYKASSPTGGYRWPVGEWVTVNIHLKPGYVRDGRVPNQNHQYDLDNELVVDTTYFTPTNDGTFIEFDTTMPRPFRFHPVSRGTLNYFKNWIASWPATILGVAGGPYVYSSYSHMVEESQEVTRAGGPRLHWKMKKRGTAYAMPPVGVVPANGDRMYTQIDRTETAFNDMPVGTPALKQDVYELQVIKADGTKWQIFRKRDYLLQYGSEGEMRFGNDPPGWNRFQPTGYANINDNLTPFPKTTWYRFGQVIFSKQPIPDPVDDEAPVQSTAPQWFNEMPGSTWFPLAKGTNDGTWQGGTRLDQSVPNVDAEYVDLCQNNNGATVAPDYKEFIIALNGGHAGNPANDAYGLKFNQAVPGWYQIVERTPVQYTNIAVNNATPGSLNPVTSYPADEFVDRICDGNQIKLAQPYYVPGTWADGPQVSYTVDINNLVLPGTFDHTTIQRRPRSLHTNNHTHYHNGKVWWPIMDAYNEGTGPTSGHKLSLDFQGIKNNPSLKTWVYGQLAPWQYHGPITEWPSGSSFTTNADFGTAALDRVTGRIWYRGQSTDKYWCMETVNNPGSHLYFTGGLAPNDLTSNGSAIAHLTDVNDVPKTLWVMLESDSSGGGGFYIKIADVTGASAVVTPTWSRQIPLNSANFEWAYGIKNYRNPPDPAFPGYAMGYGMVWHAPSQCFLVYNCDQMPHSVANVRGSAAVRKLSPPLVNGKYDSSGSWSWSEVTLATPEGAPEVLIPSKAVAGGGASSHSRFNLIPDFDGLGNALLIHQSVYNAPTWVAKIGVI